MMEDQLPHYVMKKSLDVLKRTDDDSICKPESCSVDVSWQKSEIHLHRLRNFTQRPRDCSVSSDDKQNIACNSAHIKIDLLSSTRRNTSCSNTNIKHHQIPTITNFKKPLKYLRKTTKPNLIVPLLTSLILFTTIIPVAQTGNNVKVVKFRQNQRLYFDKLSSMNMLRGEWKLITYYDMKPYWSGMAAFNKYRASLQQICNEILMQMYCDFILVQLGEGYTELEHYNRMLLGQHSSTKPTRLWQGEGKYVNHHFGVLDAKFAEQYEKDIKLLCDNQKIVRSNFGFASTKACAPYWKNQTSIVESEYNELLKWTEQSLSKQHMMVNQLLLKMTISIQALKYGQNNTFTEELAIAAITFSNMLHKLKSLQKTLLETTMDIYHGRFNSHILTPEQLQGHLKAIANQLPYDVSLPVDNIQTDLRKIYKLLKIRSRMLCTNKNVNCAFMIFEIRIPLMNRDSFEVFKVVSIPKVVGDSVINIKPISEFVAVNLEKETYITMTDESLRACFILDSYLCHIQKPTYRLKSDVDFCLSDRGHCQTFMSPCRDSWLESSAINNYLYICCNECPIRTICGDDVTGLQLRGAGIVVLRDGCIIKTQRFTVVAHKLQTGDTQTKHSILKPVIAPINNIINISLPDDTGPKDLDMESSWKELIEIDEKIKYLKERADVLDTLSYHDIHHYTVIYVVFIMGLVAIVLLVYWRRRPRSRTSIPATIVSLPIASKDPSGEDGLPK